MKHLHLEPIGGISGDMLLSLMVDLGFNPEILSKTLSSLSKESIKVEFEDVDYGFLKGKKLKEKKIFNKPFIEKKSVLGKVLKNLKVCEEIREEL
ncbi:MAG: nickel insertion protein, partial [Thermoanaerobaculia bacterium]